MCICGLIGPSFTAPAHDLRRSLTNLRPEKSSDARTRRLRPATSRRSGSNTVASAPTLLWLRHDLRLADHPALGAALARGLVVPVFIWAPAEEGDWPPGPAARWWLHDSLVALDKELRARGSRLVLRRGPTLTALRLLAGETGATAVVWSRRYEPAAVARDTHVKRSLRADGLAADSFAGHLLREPWEVRAPSGEPFHVFGQYAIAHAAVGPLDEPLLTPPAVPGPDRWPESVAIDDLGLRPPPDLAVGLRAAWVPGCVTADVQLQTFVRVGLPNYPDARDRPAISGGSRLSPHLHWGEISPRQVLRAVMRHGGPEAEVYIRELVWRDFGAHLLFHAPRTATEPLRREFAAFPWRDDAAGLRTWQQGRTGYPIVDAGMRELCSTGWMHNRVRMIVASFLTRDLLVNWLDGAKWFWESLVDADLASNAMNWQWAAGTGTDSGAYPRIFNPVTQGEKFDPKGEYVRAWLPELAALPHAFVHRPWTAPARILADAGVVLGTTYPEPVVDHAAARKRAMATWERVVREP